MLSENSSDIYYRNKQPHIPKSQVLFTVTIFNDSLSCIWWPPFWQQFRWWSSTAVIWWNSNSKVGVFILTAITVSNVLIFYCCPNKLPQTWRLKNMFIILQFCKSEVHHGSHQAPIKVSAGPHSFRELGRRACPAFPSSWRRPLLTWLGAPSSIFTAAILNLWPPAGTSLWQALYL